MTLVARFRDAVARRARTVPMATHLLARYRRRQYERRISGFLEHRDGHAGRLPSGG
jgi:hypothetical protein